MNKACDGRTISCKTEWIHNNQSESNKNYNIQSQASRRHTGSRDYLPRPIRDREGDAQRLQTSDHVITYWCVVDHVTSCCHRYYAHVTGYYCCYSYGGNSTTRLSWRPFSCCCRWGWLSRLIRQNGGAFLMFRDPVWSQDQTDWWMSCLHVLTVTAITAPPAAWRIWFSVAWRR